MQMLEFLLLNQRRQNRLKKWLKDIETQPYRWTLLIGTILKHVETVMRKKKLPGPVFPTDVALISQSPLIDVCPVTIMF